MVSFEHNKAMSKSLLMFFFNKINSLKAFNPFLLQAISFFGFISNSLQLISIHFELWAPECQCTTVCQRQLYQCKTEINKLFLLLLDILIFESGECISPTSYWVALAAHIQLMSLTPNAFSVTVSQKEVHCPAGMAETPSIQNWI